MKMIKNIVDKNKIINIKQNNKRFLLGLMFCMAILMVNLCSATTWTRLTDYNEQDIREVTFKNWWGLGGEQGTMKLLSHELDDKGEIKTLQVVSGWQVTMYYDFNFNELIENGLGDVEFINMRTGESIEKDWKYVYWANETRQRDICIETIEDKNGTECSRYGIENYTWEGWKDYNSKDITKDIKRIGIMINNRNNEYIDGIWNIGNKRLSEHATWYVLEGHGQTITGTPESQSGKTGMRIYVTNSSNLVNVTFDTTYSTATKFYIMNADASSTLSGPYTISGGVANVGDYFLNAGTSYMLAVDNDGSSYALTTSASATGYNYTGTNIIWTGSMNWNGAISHTTDAWIFAIETLYLEDGRIDINMFSPENSANLTNSNVNFIFNVTEVGNVDIKNVSLFINGTVEQTNTSGIEGNYTFTETLSDGAYNWGIYAYDTNNTLYTSSSNYTFVLDATAPTITINYGNGTLDYGNLNTNHTINYTITDTNLDTCWIDYNSTNTTIPCTSGEINTTNFTLQSGIYNATIYANDTSGNLNSSFFEWDYRLLKWSETFTSSTLSGATNPFTILFETNGTPITVAYLNYNGTRSLGSISSSGNNYTLTRNNIAPGVTTATNLSFFWEITMSDSFGYNTTSQNQTVSNIVINSTCAGMYTLYNLTLVDELTQTKLNATANETLIEVDLTLYTSSRGTLLLNYNNSFSKVNPAAICVDNNLSGGETFSMDLQIQYSATNYSKELYNVERYVLNSSTLNQNVTLYDLETDKTQKFKLIARDSSYLPVSNALIQIERKYIQNGSFYITEIPKTDEVGISSASLQVNDVIYNFKIYQAGVLISEFTNVLAICQTPLVTQCEIDFNAAQEAITIPNYEEGNDFNFTLGYNSTSRLITSQFTIPSGEPSIVRLVVNSTDSLGTSVCSDTLTSSSGTLTCTVPNNFGNSTVIAKLYKDNVEEGKGSIVLNKEPGEIYGVILVILSLMVVMTLFGIGLSDNPIVTSLFIFVGLLLITALNLVKNTGFIGTGATILFFAIATILVIIKAGRRS